MTGPEPKPAKTKPSTRARKLLRGVSWALLIIAALSGLLLGGLYWSVTSESGSRALIDALSRWSGGTVQVEGWQGRVYGKFQAKRLRLHLAAMDIDAERIAVDWHPAALRLGALSIDNLQVGRLEIRNAVPNEPAHMPTSLRLPFRLHIVSFDVGLLAVGDRAPAKLALPPPSLQMTDIAGSVDSNADAHLINRLALSLPAGRVTGKGEIKVNTPFALNLQASFAGTLADRTVAVDGKAEGSLDKLTLHMKASGDGVSGDAEAQVLPFAALPLERMHIALRGIDPALFNPAAPHALLDVTANLTPRLPGTDNNPAGRNTPNKPAGNGAAGKDPLAWQISGPVEVLNRQPATLDKGGLPVEHILTQLAWASGVLQLDDMQIALPGQGSIKGKVRWQALATDPLGRIDADISVERLDPARLHTKLHTMQIAGTIAGKSAPAVNSNVAKTSGIAVTQAQEFRIDLASGTYHLNAKGAQRAGVLELEQATLTAGVARLEASGRWQWQDPHASSSTAGAASGQAFSAKGRLQHFDPHAFVQTAPVGNLNAEFSVTGALQPAWRANLNLDVATSTLAAYPLQGHAAFIAEPQRIHDADISMDVLGNNLKANGALGLPTDRLQVQVDAPQLGRLQAGLHGRVVGQGTVGGSLQEPFATINAQADALGRDGGPSVESLSARLQIEPGANGRVDGRVDLKGLITGGDPSSPLARSASVVLTGKRDAHTLRIDAALMKDETLSATAEGGWRSGARDGSPDAWIGRLTQFVAQGPLALRLKNAADITLSPQRIALGKAALVADNGSVELTTTEWTPLRSVARGRMTGLQIGFAVDEYQRTVMRGKSLQLGAEWDVTLAERVNGLVRVFREGGDFILQGDVPIALGLETLEVNLAAQEDRLALSALMNGRRVGAINFAGTALARRNGNSVELDPAATLAGVGHLEVPTLDWLGPVIDQNLRTGGSVVGDFNILGTAAKPEGNGRIVGSKLSVALADQGLRLRDGQVELGFDASRVTLSKLDFRAERSLPAPDPRLRVLNLPGAEGAAASDNSGRISGSGGIELKDGLGAFNLKIEHVPILQRADQWVLVSGTAGVASGWDHMDLTARLRADAGFVGVPKSGAPSLGDDVVVRGRQGKPPQRMRVNADIDFDFGSNFIIKAWGIDTWLDGQLRVQLAQGQQPRATGALRARDGIFDAYGQKLAIDRGLINFNGPLDNPALNVVAMRKGLAVEAGVEVTGLVKQPRVRLVSDPEVPESEKLSWILLGRPSDAGTADAGLLISAASAAFGGDGPGIAQRVANSFGFDDVTVGQGGNTPRAVQSRVASNSTSTSSIAGGGSANDQVLTLGKRLSSRAYLALEQNLVGTESVVKLTYELTRYLSLIARGGTDNSLDLQYEISFR